MDVRMVDSDAGSDGSKVDRMVQALKVSQGQTRVLCVQNNYLDVTTAPRNGIIATDEVSQTDDFISMAGQFTEFRIRAIKFDVYDINPSRTVGAMFSTFHDVWTSTAPTYSFPDVVDGADSKTVPPGTGKATFYWVAHGVHEMEFQATSPTGAIVDRFGGLRYAMDGGSAGSKYQFVWHAVVDFRGRK